VHEHKWVDMTKLDDCRRQYWCVKCGAHGEEIDMYGGWSEVLVVASTEPHDSIPLTR